MAQTKLNSGLNLEIKKNKSAAPTKQTINLVRPKSKVNPIRLILILLVVIVVLAVFVKFGIVDQQAKLQKAKDYRDQMQTQLDLVDAQMSDYETVADEYGRYSYGWMDESETDLVSRTELLDLLNNKILPKATVSSYDVSGNAVTLNLSGITLEEGSLLVKDLEADPIVYSAMIRSAVAEEAAEAYIEMTLVLAKEVEAE